MKFLLRLKFLSTSFLSLSFAFSLVSCSEQTPPAGSKEVVMIGLIAPLSGDVADLGNEILKAAELAVSLENTSSHDLKFELVPRDDSMSVATASTAVRALLKSDIEALIGASISSLVKAEIEALKGAQIPLLTPTATASEITAGGGSDFVFRVIPPNQFQGIALANFAKAKGIKSAAILFQQDDYSIDLKNSFEKAFAEKGGTIVSVVPFESEETDFRTQLSQVSKLEPGAILCAAQHVNISRILIRAKELGLHVPILSGETAFTQKLLDAAGTEASEIDFFTTGSPVDFEAPSAELNNFIKAFQEKYGQKPGLYGSYSYDATNVILQAIRESRKSQDKDLISVIRNTKSFPGVTGTIEFNPNGDNTTDYQIYEVVDEKFTPLN